jgi:hypothetical protein
MSKFETTIIIISKFLCRKIPEELEQSLTTTTNTNDDNNISCSSQSQLDFYSDLESKFRQLNIYS